MKHKGIRLPTIMGPSKFANWCLEELDSYTYTQMEEVRVLEYCISRRWLRSLRNEVWDYTTGKRLRENYILRMERFFFQITNFLLL